jgi:hypothetical protein
MLHHRANGGRKVDSEWHEFRANARKTAFSKEEFSAIDQERHDLETAGITGEDNPESYNGRERFDQEGSTQPIGLEDDPVR